MHRKDSPVSTEDAQSFLQYTLIESAQIGQEIKNFLLLPLTSIKDLGFKELRSHEAYYKVLRAKSDITSKYIKEHLVQSKGDVALNVETLNQIFSMADNAELTLFSDGVEANGVARCLEEQMTGGEEAQSREGHFLQAVQHILCQSGSSTVFEGDLVLSFQKRLINAVMALKPDAQEGDQHSQRIWKLFK